jgi:hypothetical protein
MKPIHRSAHAPVGTALFLFVGLAIIPVSLRAAGVQISFAPRLTAANDAWQQVAEVFGASYRPSTRDLSVVNRETGPSSPDGTSEGIGGFVCSRTAEESPTSEPEVSDMPLLKSTVVRKSKGPSQRPVSVNEASLVAVPVTINANFEKIIPAISALGALKVASLRRAQLLKSIDKGLLEPSFQPLVELRNLPGSNNIRVSVSFKKAVAGSTAKAAERKVFAAMASARRRECDRAMLTGFPAGSPDYGEF